MNAPSKKEELLPQTISFQLDGKAVYAYEGETILKAAQRHGVAIPHLCYKDGMRPDGNCRACVVEIQGERTLAPSCCRNVTAGMEVSANSARMACSLPDTISANMTIRANVIINGSSTRNHATLE